MIERPREGEFAEFYRGYVMEVADADVISVLERQQDELLRLAAEVSPERETHRYAPGKWSIREVVGHLTDGERVFGYRAYCIARGEQGPLPGFDEDRYVADGDSDRQPLLRLAEEFVAARAANLTTFRRLDETALARLGNANGRPISVRALAFIMAGHVRHHLEVVRERYRPLHKGESS